MYKHATASWGRLEAPAECEIYPTGGSQGPYSILAQGRRCCGAGGGCGNLKPGRPSGGASHFECRFFPGGAKGKTVSVMSSVILFLEKI